MSKKNEVFHAMFFGPYEKSRTADLRQRLTSSESNRGQSTPTDQTTSNNVVQIYDSDVDGRAFKNLIRYFRIQWLKHDWITDDLIIHVLNHFPYIFVSNLNHDWYQQHYEQLTINGVLHWLWTMQFSERRKCGAAFGGDGGGDAARGPKVPLRRTDGNMRWVLSRAAQQR